MINESPKHPDPEQLPELRKRNEASMQKLRQELARLRERLGQRNERKTGGSSKEKQQTGDQG